jgi:hypothetical protein
MPRKVELWSKQAPEEVKARLRAQVIELYQQGTPLSAITRETGVPRATIYLIRRQAGLEPDRAPRAGDDEVTVAEILDRLHAVEQHNAVLRVQLEREQALNNAILDRLGLTPERMVELLAGKPLPPTRSRKTRQASAN